MDRMKEESSIPSWWSKNQKYLQIRTTRWMWFGTLQRVSAEGLSGNR